jgi:hypothetical protein
MLKCKQMTNKVQENEKGRCFGKHLELTGTKLRGARENLHDEEFRYNIHQALFLHTHQEGSPDSVMGAETKLRAGRPGVRIAIRARHFYCPLDIVQTGSDAHPVSYSMGTGVLWGTRWRSWLRHCATSRKVASSIPDGVIGMFQ